ncbi:prolipoprotein diacylglyceryl transferase [Herbivorax sp. ANBcel31]|uniref:prolipoprotein diacylglyceryl transferase n=1 Tax=Herbivorax sp. ANBcel31 TaxID=3069754 RepID=UPI0027B7AEE2|nr:prolipoprotein diacylglyceryl transferase [Herbivorax sp. ANBcel31]MDQ2086888.1 prolipoprotein diacylglyceryl transferase [Herbivorax sp. ANBcel31]
MDYVKFPNMGDFEIPIDSVAFEIFGISVLWYGIIISFGFIMAVFLGMRNCKRFGISQEQILDIVLWGAPAGIIGARLYYVMFNWSEFGGDLLKIINIRAGGLAIYGGLIGAVLSSYIYCRVKKIDLLNLLDLAGPYFLLAQAIGRWGNFTNQEAFGVNTTLPWGMTSDTIRKTLERINMPGVDSKLPVHPTFLYESLWNFAAFFFIMWYRKKYKIKGELFFLYMILYGLGRFWIERLRIDSLYLGSFRISQLLALAFVVVFSAIFIIRRKKCKSVSE